MPSSAPVLTVSVAVRAVAVLVMTVGLVGAGSWARTASRDEAATVSAVARTWGRLGQLPGPVDVVHALCHASTKVWLDLIGISTSTSRTPSVPARGLAEITLLGQNVNAYGVEFGDRGAFAKPGRSDTWFTATAVLLVLRVAAVPVVLLVRARGASRRRWTGSTRRRPGQLGRGHRRARPPRRQPRGPGDPVIDHPLASAITAS